MAENYNREFKILAIDGGGLRGLMPATFLAELEQLVNKPLCYYFDLVCGTSTGGIIALAIASEQPMSVIQQLYEDKASEIFPPLSNRNLWGKLKRYKEVFCGMGGLYLADPLERELKNVFKLGSGEFSKMKDAKTRLCIPAIDLTNGKVVVYKTPHEVLLPSRKCLLNDANKNMWEVARATSAAPTFFRTAKIKDSYLVDGGLWANNPSLVGMVEALRCGYAMEEIKILSLGTGNTVFQIEEQKARKMNLRNWGISGLIELSFEVQAQAVENEVGTLLKKENYFRIQHNFKKNIPMADISRAGDLKASAQQLFRENYTEIQQVFLANPVSKYK
jgi:patatin-like phospholipase/acyl hydrolase